MSTRSQLTKDLNGKTQQPSPIFFSLLFLLCTFFTVVHFSCVNFFLFFINSYRDFSLVILSIQLWMGRVSGSA